MPVQVKARSNSGDQHSADVNTLVYNNGKLYSGADDGKIIIWDKDLNKLREIQAHPTTVYCIAFGNSTLYSCSNDGAVLSWDPDTLELRLKILQVENEMYRLAFSDGVLYSSDDQGNVRSHKDNVVKGLYALLEPLREVIVQNKCIYTVRDLDLVLTEIKGEKTFEIRATFSGRAPMCLIEDKLCFSSRSGKDIIIHEKLTPYKNVCEVKNAHDMVINALTGSSSNGDTFLFSGAWDKLVKRWKIENGACNLVDFCDTGEVINVMTNGDQGTVYIGCGDGSLARLDY
ncbi:WD40 domain-containing protein [Oryctes borbonicus]|uniref:WD40 domain-containing protein n=1 Tax=Oryctes borbonicus TaxID=1629725 RepID=A0A0T6AY03_9SCAR|nr:WD40 domain-containing protein [Oryctes borbonicus]